MNPHLSSLPDLLLAPAETERERSTDPQAQRYPTADERTEESGPLHIQTCSHRRRDERDLVDPTFHSLVDGSVSKILAEEHERMLAGDLSGGGDPDIGARQADLRMRQTHANENKPPLDESIRSLESDVNDLLMPGCFTERTNEQAARILNRADILSSGILRVFDDISSK